MSTTQRLHNPGPRPARALNQTRWWIDIGAATISIAVGVIAIAGWIFGLAVLTQFFSSRSAMQPVTAICAIVAGLAVISHRWGWTGRAFTQAAAIAIALMALPTLVAYALDVDLGTDLMLFGRDVALQPVPYPHPGRMAAPTASAFLLLSLALFFACRPGRVAGHVVSASATAVLLLVTIALLSHLFLAEPLTGVLGFTQVSLPTATALGGLSVGVLALRPDDGWVRVLVGDSIGATVARWLLPVVVILPVGVALLALQGQRIGLYPADFRMALTTASTIILLGAAALWGSRQLDKFLAVKQTAEALRKSEATLRAFFETEGLFAAIIERQDGALRYAAATKALAGLYDRADLVGLSVLDVEGAIEAGLTEERLASLQASGLPFTFEQSLESGAGTRCFLVTISPVTGGPPDRWRFAVAAFEITDRKRAEAHQSMLLDELNHRVKNTLAVVQSLAQQSFRGDRAHPDARQTFEARLAAVAAAHSLLVRRDWTSVSASALVTDVVGPGCGADRSRIDASGPDLALPARASVSIALALHELCTNAVKYGALSNESGRVQVRWSIPVEAPDRLQFVWTESGGPPVVAPTSRGFGSRLIERALSVELGRPMRMEFHREGVVCIIDAPLNDDALPRG